MIQATVVADSLNVATNDRITTVHSIRCTLCDKSLPVVEFGKCKDSKDGFRHQCKKCRRDERRTLMAGLGKTKVYREEVLELKSRGLRKCTKCLEIKPLKSYCKGNLDWCSACRRNANTVWRRKKGEVEKRIRNPELLSQGLKECFKCDRVLTLSDFYKCKHSDDGHASNCKECVKQHQNNSERRQRDAARMRKFRDGNTEYLKKHRVQQRKRRAWKHDLDSGLVTQEFLDVLYATEVCAYRGKTVEEKNRTADHVVPLKRRGLHHPDNLVMACGSCNFRKSTLTGDEFREKMRKSNDKSESCGR